MVKHVVPTEALGDAFFSRAFLAKSAHVLACPRHLVGTGGLLSAVVTLAGVLGPELGCRMTE